MDKKSERITWLLLNLLLLNKQPQADFLVLLSFRISNENSDNSTDSY